MKKLVLAFAAIILCSISARAQNLKISVVTTNAGSETETQVRRDLIRQISTNPRYVFVTDKTWDVVVIITCIEPQTRDHVTGHLCAVAYNYSPAKFMTMQDTLAVAAAVAPDT